MKKMSLLFSEESFRGKRFNEKYSIWIGKLLACSKMLGKCKRNKAKAGSAMRDEGVR